MDDVIIVGAGGHGKVVLDTLLAGRAVRPVGFVDANPSLTDSYVGGLPILGSANALPMLRRQKLKRAIVAIGDNRTRLRYMAILEENGFQLVTAVHPSAHVAPTASLGKNVVVAAQAAVVTESKVGDGTIVNTSAVVDHECELAEGVHVCPGAVLAGRVRVGRGTFVGMGAQVIQCRAIGQFATIGAGSVVIEDVPEFSTAVGIPARVIKVALAASAEAA